MDCVDKQQQQIITDKSSADKNGNCNCKYIFLTFEFKFIIIVVTSIFHFIVIDYRGSNTIRMKRWMPEIEQKIKYAFNVIKNENEAVQYLLNLGLTTHEIDLVLQHFLSNAESNMRKQQQQHQRRIDDQARNPLTVQEQQLELIGFSQSVCISLKWKPFRTHTISYRQINLILFILFFFLLNSYSFIC